MIAIINASPLIYLGKLGVITNLPRLFSQIYTTPMVKNEVLRKEEAPEKVVLSQAFQSWLIVQEVPSQSALYESLLQMNLHQGEVEIISLAKELQKGDPPHSIVILDDLDARDTAKALGLIVTGTIGILLALTEQEVISIVQCRQHLTYLVQNTSFRISSAALLQIEARLDLLEHSS